MENSGINRIVQAPRKKSHIKWLLVFLLILAGSVVYYYFLGGQALLSPQNENSYQAVFLTNGQVYFGKLGKSGRSFVLRDVYYLKATSPLQSASSTPDAASLTDTQKNIELVKLGAELHGPEDAVFIEKSQVLFWENMKDSSKVLEAIKQYQASTN